MRLAFRITFISVAFAATTYAQSPTPEFFGVYALADGKLYAVDEAGTPQAPTTVVPIGSRSAVGEVLNGKPVASRSGKRVAELPAATQFVAFYQPSGMVTAMSIASELKLLKLPYINQLIVDTGWPKNVTRRGVEAGWDIVEGAVESIPLLMKPYNAKSDMVLAVPSKPLTPSVYLLTNGEAGRTRYLFVVSPAEASNARCVDLTCKYAMMMEQCVPHSCQSTEQLTIHLPVGHRDAKDTPSQEVATGRTGFGFRTSSDNLPVFKTAEGNEIIAHLPAGSYVANAKGSFLGIPREYQLEQANGRTKIAYPTSDSKSLNVGWVDTAALGNKFSYACDCEKVRNRCDAIRIENFKGAYWSDCFQRGQATSSNQ